MSASGPGSMLPGGSAEERGYRRFLEVFLGEFRGPFLSPEPPPPLPQQEQQPPQPQLQPPPSDGEREGEGEGDAAEEEEEEEEGSAGGGGGGDSQEPSEDQREEDADAAAATPEDPGADAAPGEPEPPEEEEEEEAGEAPPSPPPPARAPTPPLPALPRPLSEPITEEEVEGECLDLCLHQLYKYNCPSLLAAALARATADEVLQSDLSAHYLPKHADSPDGIIQVETVKLARTVFSKLHETCSSWARDFPLQQKPHRFYETSIHAIKNMRRKMEDKHVCIPDFNTLFNLEDQEEQAYFAVFDGHGGVDAAIYASIHLHVNLVHQETFQQDPAEALCRAFHVTDERFVQKAARESLRCGTTGVVTFIRGNVLHVAWLGDSQVMLVRRGQAVELMKPHKPDREDEKKRIEALGGCVIWFGAWRVNGSLSVSRAIGDAEHKPYICGDADSASMVLDGSEDYLILACDGFYDTVSPEEAVKVVADHLQENQGDSSMVAHKLVASARDAGSSDNITVIVVFLRDMSAAVSASQETEWTENSFQDGQEDSGDDPENQGKRPWPQHQVSAPADLGYDGREDSFTDRTTLSAGPTRATFVEEPGYLDLRKADACKLPSAKRLSPEPGLTAAAVPKRATLESGFPAESQPAAAAATFPPCGQSSGPGPLTSLSLGVAPGLILEYSRASPPPASTRLEGERFKAWGRRASIFSHFRFCDPKRWQRLARLKPKLHRLLLLEPRPLSRPEGLPGSINGRRSSRGPRGGLWQGLSSSCQSRGGGSILLLLRQSRCLAEPGLL